MNRPLREQPQDAIPLVMAKKTVANDYTDLAKRGQICRGQLRSGQQRGRREATTAPRRRQRRQRQVRQTA